MAIQTAPSAEGAATFEVSYWVSAQYSIRLPAAEAVQAGAGGTGRQTAAAAADPADLTADAMRALFGQVMRGARRSWRKRAAACCSATSRPSVPTKRGFAKSLAMIT